MDFFYDSCLICGEKFFEKNEMAKHMKNNHTVPNDFPKEERLTSDQCADCPFCPFKTNVSADLEFHVLTSHSQEVATPEKKIHRENSSDMGGQHRSATSDINETNLYCPLCSLKSFDSLTLLNEHIDLHLLSGGTEKEVDNEATSVYCNDDELLAMRLQKHEDYVQMHNSRKAVEEFYFKQLQDQHGTGGLHKKSNYSKQAFKSMERSVGRRNMSAFDYFDNKFTILESLEQGNDDGLTTSPELLNHLKNHIERNIGPRQHAWLCSTTDHIGRGPGDSGWGCGYRNIQMILSCLIKHPTYREKILCAIGNRIPSIPKLQEMIEKAWAEGYDPQGREQLEGKLVGTRKWIGATEAFILLASLHLHCRIMDFSGYSGPNKSHPLLLKWLCMYFGSASTSTTQGVTQSDKAPLYLQHDGHSRTIVGILCENEDHSCSSVKYLHFDPGHAKNQIWKKENQMKKKGQNKSGLAQGRDNESALQFNLFLKAGSSLGKSQYQIVCVEGIASTQRIIQQKNVNALCEKI